MISKEDIKEEKEHLKFVNEKLEERLSELGFKVVENEEKYKEFQKMMWQDFHSFDAGDIASALSEDEREVRRKNDKY